MFAALLRQPDGSGHICAVLADAVLAPGAVAFGCGLLCLSDAVERIRG
jgi:hypothetical protein